MIALLSVLFVVSQLLGVFDLKGAAAAVVIGGFITLIADIQWLILLLVFAFSAHIATKAWLKSKKEKLLQEGNLGERGYSNVMYAGIVGFIIAVVYGISRIVNVLHGPYFFLFSVSFAVIEADTFASEIGVMDSKTFMITNFKRVSPGINGGISFIGTAASFLGAFIIALSYSLLAFGNIRLFPLITITLLGALGSVIDSIFGATLENKKFVTKGQVNLLSTLIIVAAAVPLAI